MLYNNKNDSLHVIDDAKEARTDFLFIGVIVDFDLIDLEVQIAHIVWAEVVEKKRLVVSHGRVEQVHVAKLPLGNRMPLVKPNNQRVRDFN